MLRRCLKGTKWPKIYTAEVRIWDAKLQVEKYAKVALLLPHELLHVLGTMNSAETLTQLDGAVARAISRPSRRPKPEMSLQAALRRLHAHRTSARLPPLEPAASGEVCWCAPAPRSLTGDLPLEVLDATPLARLGRPLRHQSGCEAGSVLATHAAGFSRTCLHATECPFFGPIEHWADFLQRGVCQTRSQSSSSLPRESRCDAAALGLKRIFARHQSGRKAGSVLAHPRSGLFQSHAGSPLRKSFSIKYIERERAPSISRSQCQSGPGRKRPAVRLRQCPSGGASCERRGCRPCR